MLSESTGFCYTVLENLIGLVKELKSTLKKEKEYFQLICSQLNNPERESSSSQIRVMSINVNNTRRVEKEAILEDFSECEEKHEALLDKFGTLLNQIHIFNANDMLLVKEPISDHSELFQQSAKLLRRISEFKKNYSNTSRRKQVEENSPQSNLNNNLTDSYNNNDVHNFSFNAHKNTKQFSYKVFVELSNSVKSNAFKGVETDWPSVSKFNFAEMQEKNSQIIGAILNSQKIANRILNNNIYFAFLDDSYYAQLVKQMKFFSVLNTNKINKEFIMRLGKIDPIATFNIPFLHPKNLWILDFNCNSQNIGKLSEVFMKLTLASEIADYSPEQLKQYVEKMFGLYFYTVQEKTIKVVGQLRSLEVVKNCLATEECRSALNLRNAKCKVYCWLEDILSAYSTTEMEKMTSNISSFLSENFKKSEAELNFLRRKCATLIVEKFLKDNPLSVIEELKNYEENSQIGGN